MKKIFIGYLYCCYLLDLNLFWNADLDFFSIILKPQQIVGIFCKSQVMFWFFKMWQNCCLGRDFYNRPTLIVTPKIKNILIIRMHIVIVLINVPLHETVRIWIYKFVKISIRIAQNVNLIHFSWNTCIHHTLKLNPSNSINTKRKDTLS